MSVLTRWGNFFDATTVAIVLLLFACRGAAPSSSQAVVAPNAPAAVAAPDATAAPAAMCDRAHTRSLVVDEVVTGPSSCSYAFFRVTAPTIARVETNPDGCPFIIVGVSAGCTNLELWVRGSAEKNPPDETWCFEVREK
jgi:hypothetical protein